MDPIDIMVSLHIKRGFQMNDILLFEQIILAISNVCATYKCDVDACSILTMTFTKVIKKKNNPISQIVTL